MKTTLTITLAFLLCVGSIGLATLSASSDNDGDGARIARGFKIASVPLTFADRNRDLVGLGSYLVNAVGGCNDCHTNPSYAPLHDPFAGQSKQINADRYLAGGRVFGVGPSGPIVSRNITPDVNGLPAGLTWDEFRTLIRTGIDPDTHRTLLVMPWPVYQDMRDRDLRAIYEYLRAIPHAEPATAPLPSA